MRVSGTCSDSCSWERCPGLVSVIVPVHDGSRTIVRLLDSLASQSYKLIEVIVVDNASSDGTGDICLGWGETHPNMMRYIRTEEKGVSRARNTGLAFAKGEYIAFADADDFVLPDFIRALVETRRRFECDVSVVGICPVREEDPSPLINACWQEARLVDVDEVFSRTFTTSEIGGFLANKLFRAEVLEGKALDEKCSLCEDMLLFYECLSEGASVAYCSTPLYCYVIHNGSASHSFEKSRNADGSGKYEDVAQRIISMFPGRSDLHNIVKARLYKQAVEEKKYFYELGAERGNAWVPYVRESIRSNRRSFYAGKHYDSRTKVRYLFWDVLAPFWIFKPLINRFRNNRR